MDQRAERLGYEIGLSKKLKRGLAYHEPWHNAYGRRGKRRQHVRRSGSLRQGIATAGVLVIPA